MLAYSTFIKKWGIKMNTYLRILMRQFVEAKGIENINTNLDG